jgi:hypothetical protein
MQGRRYLVNLIPGKTISFKKQIINEWYFYCSFMQYFSFFLYLNGAERLNTATQQSGVFTDFLFT